jgi:hypothetical protein
LSGRRTARLSLRPGGIGKCGQTSAEAAIRRRNAMRLKGAPPALLRITKGGLRLLFIDLGHGADHRIAAGRREHGAQLMDVCGA